MPIPYFNHKKFLDGEEIFKKYASLGKSASFGILQKWLKESGKRNPISNKPPCRMAAWNSMWRWAVHNPDKARKYYDAYLLQYGEYMSDEEWKSLLLKRAANLFSASRYERYKRENGFE